METEGDERDVACLPPVHLLPPGEPLVDEVSAGKQAAVHGDIGDPREAAKHLSHGCSVMYRRNIHKNTTANDSDSNNLESRQ